MTELSPGDERFKALVRVYVWSYPLLFAARLRRNMTAKPVEGPSERSAAAAMNLFGHQRLLSDPSYRVGVAPNVDTLYSVAWLDLREGPFRLDLPRIGDRYYTFQVGFADSSSVAFGTRTHGEQLPPVCLRLAGTEQPAVPNALHVESPARYAMVAGRILVQPDDPSDFALVHALQDGVALRRLVGESWEETTGSSPAELDPDRVDPSPGLDHLARLADILDGWTEVELSPQVRDDLCAAGFSERLELVTPPSAVLADQALSSALTSIERAVSATGTKVNGWSVNYRGVEFGEDWLLRAAVAHSQIYVNPAAEAIYPVVEVDETGSPLTGARHYEVRFGADGLPPVQFFWSLTMYHAQGFLVANELGRYAIGDRTAGLRREPDGSLVLQISHEPPGGVSNWLPAPEGEFRLMLRLYGPSPQCLAGAWAPPPVRAL